MMDGMADRDELGIYVQKLLVTLAVVGSLWLLAELHAYVTYVLLAMVLAAAMVPVVKAGQARGIPRAVVVAALVLGVGLALVLLGYAVVPVLVTQGEQLARSLPGLLASLPTRFPQLPWLANLTPNLGSLAGTLQGGLMQGVSLVVVAALSLGNMALILTLTIMMALDAPALIQGLLGLLPRSYASTLDAQLPEMGNRLALYVAGQAAISGILAVICLVTLLVLKVPYALLLAVVLGLISILPMVGGFIGMIPAVAVALFVSPLTALWTAAVLFVAIHLVGSFVAPVIFQRSVNLHPIMAISALVIGFTLGGLGGALVAVPMAAALQVLVVNLYLVPKLAREQAAALGTAL
ncbi:MAG: family transporter [Cyanobacteria bacterium RYN_339]|nr:family transporter [Cyanobacteria bacterium RYN_339]